VQNSARGVIDCSFFSGKLLAVLISVLPSLSGVQLSEGICVDTAYINSGPIGAGEKTPADLTENNVHSFLFQAQIIGYVGYVAIALTDPLSALLDWELSLVLTNHFISGRLNLI